MTHKIGIIYRRSDTISIKKKNLTRIWFTSMHKSLKSLYSWAFIAPRFMVQRFMNVNVICENSVEWKKNSKISKLLILKISIRIKIWYFSLDRWSEFGMCTRSYNIYATDLKIDIDMNGDRHGIGVPSVCRTINDYWDARRNVGFKARRSVLIN